MERTYIMVRVLPLENISQDIHRNGISLSLIQLSNPDVALFSFHFPYFLGE